MQINKMDIRWHEKDEKPSQKIFHFEKEIFGKKYSSCPKTYQDFLKFFNHPFLKITLSFDNEIVGLLIADTLLNQSLYYLRLIGVKYDYRNAKLGTELFSNFVKSIGNNSYISFVSNNKILHHIVDSSIALQPVQIIPTDIKNILYSYNNKLCGVKPRGIIDSYYSLQPSGYSEAFFQFLIKGNIHDSK